MRKLILAVALVAVACSSVPATPGRPEVEIRQQSELFFGSGGQAPLNLSVSISNPGKEAILVRHIRISAGPGMIQYTVRPAEKFVHETIAPGETKEVFMTATAVTDRVRLSQTEPLGLRAIIDYEADGKHHQELYMMLIVAQ